MFQSKELNAQNLKSIMNANHTSEVVMTYLAMRQRNRLFSDLTTTRSLLQGQKEKIDDNDYRSFWKSLQNEGVGLYIQGRKGNHDRFRWSYPLITVAQAALTDKVVKLEPLPNKEKVSKIVTTRKRHYRKSKKTFQVEGSKVKIQTEKRLEVSVRPGLTIGISMPKGLLKSDVAILSKSLLAVAK